MYFGRVTAKASACGVCRGPLRSATAKPGRFRRPPRAGFSGRCGRCGCRRISDRRGFPDTAFPRCFCFPEAGLRASARLSVFPRSRVWVLKRLVCPPPERPRQRLRADCSALPGGLRPFRPPVPGRSPQRFCLQVGAAPPCGPYPTTLPAPEKPGVRLCAGVRASTLPARPWRSGASRVRLRHRPAAGRPLRRNRSAAGRLPARAPRRRPACRP